MKKTDSGKPNKLRVIVLDLIIVLALVIAGISAYKIYNIINGYKADRKVYTDVQDEAKTGTEIDWDELREINPDVVAWIKLEGTEIDYPVVKSRDNDEYLHTLFDGSWGNAGSIFVDCNTEVPFDQFNTVVYGHHMKDGSMFENLKNFKDADYTKEHGRFELRTPERDYYLEVSAFLNCPADSEIYTANVSEADRERYLDAVKNYAEYSTGVELGKKDKIVILSTCAYEYDGARYVIVGKLTPWS